MALQQGFSVSALPLKDIHDADTVIVPGCREVHEPVDQRYVDAILTASRNGARIASVCSGAFVLAQAGLLDGRVATTHWMNVGTLRSRFPGIFVDPSVIYVNSGNIWTSAGTAAGLDLCLELVRQDFGSSVANEVACRMVVAPHRSGSQAQYYHRTNRVAADAHDAPLPEDVLAWARSQIPIGLTVGALVAQANMSQRTLIRRFRAYYNATPHEWILTEKLRLACDLLETSAKDTIASVAKKSGFGTAENMRQHFKKQLDCSPQAYREAFTSRSRATR